jgi:hypothetical protein
MDAQYVPTPDCNFKAPKGNFHLKWNKMDVCTALQRLSLGHPKCASDLQQEFSPCVQVDTIGNSLRKHILKYYVCQSGNTSIAGYRGKRNDEVEHHCYRREEDWQTVIFSDDSHFNIFYSDG